MRGTSDALEGRLVEDREVQWSLHLGRRSCGQRGFPGVALGWYSTNLGR